MLEESKVIDKIEIVGETIQVRQRVCILKDGVEIASSFHRYSLTKNSDITNEEPKIQAVANAIWNLV